MSDGKSNELQATARRGSALRRVPLLMCLAGLILVLFAWVQSYAAPGRIEWHTLSGSGNARAERGVTLWSADGTFLFSRFGNDHTALNSGQVNTLDVTYRNRGLRVLAGDGARPSTGGAFGFRVSRESRLVTSSSTPGVVQVTAVRVGAPYWFLSATLIAGLWFLRRRRVFDSDMGSAFAVVRKDAS